MPKKKKPGTLGSVTAKLKTPDAWADFLYKATGERKEDFHDWKHMGAEENTRYILGWVGVLANLRGIAGGKYGKIKLPKKWFGAGAQRGGTLNPLLKKFKGVNYKNLGQYTKQLRATRFQGTRKFYDYAYTRYISRRVFRDGRVVDTRVKKPLY